VTGEIVSTDEVTSENVENSPPPPPTVNKVSANRKMSFSPKLSHGESQAAALALAGAAVSHAAAAFLQSPCPISAEQLAKTPNSHDSPGKTLFCFVYTYLSSSVEST
jgi:hypothetical protein